MGAIDYSGVEVLTFDCYGTLIDWEAGIAAGLGAVTRAHGVDVADEDLLTRYAGHEARLEEGPYLRYREVLGRACRGVCSDLGFEATDVEVDAFAGSVGDWPAFRDSAAALADLTRRYKLAPITNCDDDLFAASSRRLGVTFDWIVTAQQAGSYKPSHRTFELAFERIGLPRERILHVAQSLYHDHVPAKELGLRSVWINRRAGREGSGATPPAVAQPDAEFPDMASFAADALSA
ncbi:MAG TPA: haloacid dehalogenase type II [Candidatus Limnocylindrales bacterium]|nr:haloacid dehalogenase type II [Candidatus Limnocylindrales bacterium]